MDKLEIKGKVNTAICYAKVVEQDAIEQIRRMCDYDFTEDSNIGCGMLTMNIGKGEIDFAKLEKPRYWVQVP